MKQVLNKDFFNRDTLEVAENLIGKYLVKKNKRELHSYMITETEAYDGPEDKASHAYKGKTERTKIMFNPAGCWYVYLVYGMYWMLNVVTGPKNYPAAVLIRGVENYEGPGILTKKLGINNDFNGKLINKNTSLWIENKTNSKNMRNTNYEIIKTPRIGVDYADEWAKRLYRFVLKK